MTIHRQPKDPKLEKLVTFSNSFRAPHMGTLLFSLLKSLWTKLLNKYHSVVLSSLACLAGRIVVPGELSWRQSRHAKRVATPRGIFASAAKTTALARKSRQLRGLSPLLSIRSFCRPLSAVFRNSPFAFNSYSFFQNSLGNLQM